MILTDLVLVHAVAALVVVDEVVFAIAAPLVFLTVVFSRTNPVALAALAELAALVRRATLSSDALAEHSWCTTIRCLLTLCARAGVHDLARPTSSADYQTVCGR